jgi:hypothetical protein
MIPMVFSVSIVTRFYNAALLTECGQRDPCSRDLILRGRRLAKYRGVRHASAIHLSPYSMTLLAIYLCRCDAKTAAGCRAVLVPHRSVLAASISAASVGPGGVH